ncbi:MAG: HEAT repeat domain-containing protein, partial [Promethearchaeota archaeon]
SWIKYHRVPRDVRRALSDGYKIEAQIQATCPHLHPFFPKSYTEKLDVTKAAWRQLNKLLQPVNERNPESIKTFLQSIASGKLGSLSKLSIPYIIPYLEYNSSTEKESQFIRTFAVRALGITKNVEVVGPILKAFPSKPQIVTIGNKLYDFRVIWIHTLGKLQDYRATPLLYYLLGNDSDARVRSMAAYAIGWIGRSSVKVDQLVYSLNDSDKAVRTAAATSLVKLVPRTGYTNIVVSMIKEERVDFTTELATSLGNACSWSVFSILVSKLLGQNRSEQTSALVGLSALMDLQTIGPLEELLARRNLSASVRERANILLKKLRNILSDRMNSIKCFY